MPALHEQAGYEGVLRPRLPGGTGARPDFLGERGGGRRGPRGSRSFYAEQVEKFVTLYKAPPGRETYQVVLAEEPAVLVLGGMP